MLISKLPTSSDLVTVVYAFHPPSLILILIHEQVHGLTALHIAAFLGHTAVVNILLEANAQPHEPDKRGRTLFYLACQKGHGETAKELLQKLQAMDFDSINKPNDDGKTPLRRVARHDLTTILQALLERVTSTAQLDVTDTQEASKRTALHVAAYVGQSEAVSMLLKPGASTHVKDANGRTPVAACLDGWIKGNSESSELTLLELIASDSGAITHDKDIMCVAAM